jgi:general secretion pathway protein I
MNNQLLVSRYLLPKLAGFTLLEVLVALAVFAIAGTALLGSTQNNISHLSRIDKQTIARWVADNQLVELQLATQWPPKNAKGDVRMAEQKWYWQLQVVKTTDANMRAVTVNIFDAADSDKPIYALMTYVANPSKGKARGKS